MRINRTQQFSVIFAFIMVSWALLPFFGLSVFDDTTIATSIVFCLIGIAYPLTLFKPQWNKALLLLEGIIFAVTGLIFLHPLNNLLFLIIGALLAILAIFAYMKKLPKNFLKFFYKTPK